MPVRWTQSMKTTHKARSCVVAAGRSFCWRSRWRGPVGLGKISIHDRLGQHPRPRADELPRDQHVQGNIRRLTTQPECGTPEQRHTPRQGVFLGEGGPLTAIAHSTNPPGSDFISEFLVADTSVNSSGKVALSIELRDPQFDQGLFVGSRTGAFDERFRSSTSEFDAPSSRMSLNEFGQVAFQDNGIVLSNPDGTFRRILDSNASGFAAFDPSLNIFGRVAFMGFTFGDPQVQGIFTSRGGPSTW